MCLWILMVLDWTWYIWQLIPSYSRSSLTPKHDPSIAGCACNVCQHLNFNVKNPIPHDFLSTEITYTWRLIFENIHRCSLHKLRLPRAASIRFPGLTILAEGWPRYSWLQIPQHQLKVEKGPTWNTTNQTVWSAYMCTHVNISLINWWFFAMSVQATHSWLSGFIRNLDRKTASASCTASEEDLRNSKTHYVKMYKRTAPKLCLSSLGHKINELPSTSAST